MSLLPTKYQKIKQDWLELSRLLELQNYQRTNDIESLLEGIDKKIENIHIFKNLKDNIIQQECNKVHDSLSQMRSMLQRQRNNQYDSIKKQKRKTEQNCKNIFNITQKENTIIQKQNFECLNQIKRQAQQKNKLSQSFCKEQNIQILNTKNFIQKNLKQSYNCQTLSLKQLANTVGEQIHAIYQVLQFKKMQKKQIEIKLKLMAESLMRQLQKNRQKQQNLGKITYQSLLKLIQDFHHHIKYKNALN